eukprot:2269966-Pleurochrysis_carterae.AAC.1
MRERRACGSGAHAGAPRMRVRHARGCAAHAAGAARTRVRHARARVCCAHAGEARMRNSDV